MSKSKPAIFDSFADIDVLSQPEFVEIPAKDVKEGMVLLDPFLSTPVAAVDHKMRSVRDSGCVRFFCADLEDGGWREVSILASVMVKVIAA